MNEDASATATSQFEDSSSFSISRIKSLATSRGIMGKLERCPLPCKLLCVSLVSVLGMVLFGVWLILVEGDVARAAHWQTVHAKLGTLSTQVNVLLALERGKSSLKLAGNDENVTVVRAQLDVQMVIYDMYLNRELRDISMVLDEHSVHLVKEVQQMPAKLQQVRAQIDAKNVTIAQVIAAYAELVNKCLQFELRMCNLISDSAVCFLHHELLSVAEAIGLLRASGAIILQKKASTSLCHVFLTGQKNYDYLQVQLHAVATQSNAHIVNQTKAIFSTVYEHMQAISSFCLEQSTILPNMSHSHWFNLTSDKIGLVRSLAAKVSEDLVLRMDANETKSIVIVVLICIIAVTCFIGSLCSSFCFSKTITGICNSLLTNRSMATIVGNSRKNYAILCTIGFAQDFKN